MIIAIDFDGVLHQGKYPTIGIPEPDALNYMRMLEKDGHYLIINTCRAGDRLIEAINWLLSKGIPFHRVNDNCPSNKAEFGGNTRKIYADIYIDDKQVGGLPPWEQIYEYINNVKP